MARLRRQSRTRSPPLSHTADHVASRPQCHLPLATAESFTLHLSITGEPFALDYFVGPVPHDGRCPGTKKARRRAMSEVGTRITNSTVLLKSPTHPPL